MGQIECIASNSKLRSSIARTIRTPSQEGRDWIVCGYRQSPSAGDDDRPHRVVSFQNAAVLFADIVGFTRLSEELTPEASLELLHRFHIRMSKPVYLNDGSVIQRAGDAVMAAFGAPCGGTRGATNALTCAYTMLSSMAQWSVKRRTRGRFPIHIGIGIHFGAVAMGEIGIGPHKVRTLAGDTVNVARKLEVLTRKVGTTLIISRDTVDAIRRESRDDCLLAYLTEHGPQQVPGRVNAISIWHLDRALN
jgi:adenylate cyclase